MSAENSTVNLTESKEEVPVVVMDSDRHQPNEQTFTEPLLDTGLTDTAFPQIVVNRMPRVSVNLSHIL